MADLEIGSVTAKFVADVQGFVADIDKILSRLQQTGKQAIETGQDVERGGKMADAALQKTAEEVDKQVDLFGTAGAQMALYNAEVGKATKGAELSFTSFGTKAASSLDALNTKVASLVGVSSDTAGRVADEMGKVELAFRSLGGHSDLEFQKMRDSAREAYEAISQSALTTSADQARAADLYEQRLAEINDSLDTTKEQVADAEQAFKTLGIQMGKGVRTEQYKQAAEDIAAALETITTSAFSSAEDIQRASEAAAASLAALAQGGKPAEDVMQGMAASTDDASHALDVAGVAATSFGIPLERLLGIVKMATSGLGLVAAGFAAAGMVIMSAVRSMQAAVQQAEELVAVTGLSVEAADNLAATFQILGHNAGQLTTAMFRMSSQVESGGDAITKLGISLRDNNNQLKNEGDLFLEVRDAISAMGTSGERSAALMDIFGRAGRSLAPIFALSREEFKKWQDTAGGISKLTEEGVEKTKAYNRATAQLGMEFDALAQTVGMKVIPPLTILIQTMNQAVHQTGNPFNTPMLLFKKSMESDISAAQAFWKSFIAGMKSASLVDVKEGAEVAKPAFEQVGELWAAFVSSAFKRALVKGLGDAEQDIASATAKMGPPKETSKLGPDQLPIFQAEMARRQQVLQDSVAKEQAIIQKGVATRTITEVEGIRQQIAQIDRLAKEEKYQSDTNIAQMEEQGLGGAKLMELRTAAASKIAGFATQQIALEGQLSQAQGRTATLSAQYNLTQIEGLATVKQSLQELLEAQQKLDFSKSMTGNAFIDADAQAAMLETRLEGLADRAQEMTDQWTGQQAVIRADTSKTAVEIQTALAAGQASFTANINKNQAAVIALNEALVKNSQAAWAAFSADAVKAAESVTTVDDALAAVMQSLTSKNLELNFSLTTTGDAEGQIRKVQEEFTQALQTIEAAVATTGEHTTASLEAMRVATANKTAGMAKLWKDLADKMGVTLGGDLKNTLGLLIIDIERVGEVAGKTPAQIDAMVKAAAGITQLDTAIRATAAGFGKTTEEIARNDIALKQTNKTWDELSASLDEADQKSKTVVADLAKIQTVNAALKQAQTTIKGMQTELAQAQAEINLTGDALNRATLALKLYGDTWDPANAAMQRGLATAVEIQAKLDALIPARFARDLADISVRAQVLGSDFDEVGARVSAAQKNFDDTMAAMRRGAVSMDAVTAAGARLREELSNQKLHQDVERMFLSITDTFTKMADALIAGTLDIDKAFADLGKSLLTNFVQIVLHQVFDPILKEAASFVSSLISMLTGIGSGGGSGWGAALAGMVGGVVRGYLGMGPQAYGTGTMLGPPSPGGSGGSDLLGIGGSVVSGLGTAYQIIGVEMLKLPSLFSYVGQGLTYLGEAVGILTPQATAAATQLAAVATAGETAWLAGGTAAESAALVTEAAATVTEGAAVVVEGAAVGAATLGETIATLAAAVAPFTMVAGAVAAVVMGMKALSGHFDYLSKRRREQETRQGMAMKTDLAKDLEGMTLQNLMEGERRRHMEFIMAVAEYRGPQMEEFERQRKAGELGPGSLPGSLYPSEGGLPTQADWDRYNTPDLFPQSPALEQMKSLINNLTNLGMKSSWLWGQQGGGKGPGSGSGAMNELLSDGEWWDALITAYDTAIKKLLGQTEPLTKSLRVVASEATITAASLNTIADVLGIAKVDVPDFKAWVEEFEKGVNDITKVMDPGLAFEDVGEHGLTRVTGPPLMMAEDTKDDTRVRERINAAIKQMKDQIVNSLMAEPIKITGLLDLGALQKEGEDIKDTIKRVAEALQGLGDMMTRLDAESATLTNTMDVQAQMNSAMQGLYRAQVEAQKTLMETQDPTVMLAAAQQVEAIIKERYRLETELATSLMEKYRALSTVVINSIGAIADAGDMLTQMGISIIGITQASAGFVMGLDDAQLQLAALPALMKAAFAEAGQVVAAGGSVSAGLDVVLGAPVDALRDTFSEVMEILDPSARASALQGFLGQINSFFQEAVSGIKTYYAAARQEAERLADAAIKGIRDAAAAQIAPLQVVKEQAQAGLELLAEQRDAVQDYVNGIKEALALQVEALNEQKDGLQEQIDAIREALKVRVDALNEEKEAIQDALEDYVKPLQKERDEIQKTLKIRLKALNDEKEAIQDALKIRVDALEDERDLIQKTLDTQMKALTDEKDALEKILDVAQRAAQIARGLREAIKDLAIGDLAPPDAQAQLAAARAAFQQAAPEEAGAAGKTLLDTALKTGLMTRPDPEFRALWAEVTAHLQSLALGQEALASPEQATLMRLEAIEALSKSLNDTAEARLTVIADELDTLRGAAEERLDAIEQQVESLQDAATERLDVIDDLLSTANEIASTRLEAIDDELKSLNKQAETYLKPLEEGVKTIDDSIKTLNKEAKEALKPLEESLRNIDKEAKDLNDSIKVVDKSIAGINKQADKDVKDIEDQREAYLRQLSLDEQTAIGMVKDTLAPIAWQTVQAIADTGVTVTNQANDTKQIMNAVMASMNYDAWIADRTAVMAQSLSVLSSQIYSSLDTLIRGRLDTLIGIGQGGGDTAIKDALSQAGIGKIVTNTYDAAFNLAQLVWGTFRQSAPVAWPQYPTAERGMDYVPRTGPVLLHKGERVLTAQENQDYGRGGEGGGIQVTMNIYGVDDPKKLVDELEDELIRRARMKTRLYQAFNPR